MKVLTKLDTQEISTVDQGANKKKRFPITKGENQMPPDNTEALKAVIETETKGEKEFLKSLTTKSDIEKEVALASYRIIKSYFDELSEDSLKAISKATGHVETKVKEVEKKVDEGQTKIQKALNEQIEVQKTQIVTLKESHEALTKSLKDEKAVRETQLWVNKAEKELSHYPGKTSQELGEILYKAEKFDADFAKSQFDTMKQTSDTMKISGKFSAVGKSNTGDPQNAVEKLESIAKELIKKDSGLSKEDALYKAMEENQDLYEQHLSENLDQ